MGNFTRVRSYIYINGNVIQALENNTNENTIYEGHNSSMNENTGHMHTGAIGDAPQLNFFTAVNFNGLFSSANLANCQLKVLNGRLSLTTFAGTAPTTTDFITVSLPETITSGGGQLSFATTFRLTSQTNLFFDDSTTGSTFFGGGGFTFGSTAGVAWAQSVPFMLYIATNGTVPILVISRNPCMKRLPAFTLIGYKNNPPATQSQESVLACTATDVTTSHQNAPCWPIGAFRMTKNASDDWAIQSLDGQDGLFIYNNFGCRSFTMPASQNGAASGSYFSVSAGTAPTYTLRNFYIYSIDLNGRVSVDFNFSNAAGGTPGAGGNSLIIALPYAVDPNIVTTRLGVGSVLNQAALETLLHVTAANGGAGFIYQSTIVTAISGVTGANQDQAIRSIQGDLTYPAFGGISP